MRGLRFTWLVVTIGLFLAFCEPAGAAAYKQTQVFSTKDNGYVLVPTAPFQSFDNANIGDCQYETAANLVLAEWPKAHITTAEVVTAYNAYGALWQGQQVQQPDGSWLNEGLWAGQNYLIDHGFAGHRAASITQVTTRYAMVQGANHGGLEVTIIGSTLMHVLGIIQANAKELTVVDDGIIYHYTWAGFANTYTANGTNSEVLTYYAVKWAA